MKKKWLMISAIAMVCLTFAACSENHNKKNADAENALTQDEVIEEDEIKLGNREIYNPMTGEFICSIGDKVSDIQISLNDTSGDMVGDIQPGGYGGLILPCEELYGEEAKVVVMYMNKSSKQQASSQCEVIGAYGVPFLKESALSYDELVVQYDEPIENNIDEIGNGFVVFAENPFNYLGCYIESGTVTYMERYDLEDIYSRYLDQSSQSSYIGMKKMMDIILKQEYGLVCGENNVDLHTIRTNLGNVDIDTTIAFGALLFDGWMSDESDSYDEWVFATFELKNTEDHFVEVGVSKEENPDSMWIENPVSNITVYGPELHEANERIEFEVSGLTVNNNIRDIVSELGTPSEIRIPYEGLVELRYKSQDGVKYTFACNIFSGNIGSVCMELRD